MKNREFNLRMELSDQANILRIHRWFRTRGCQVKVLGKFARRVRSRAAFKGHRGSIFKKAGTVGTPA